MATCQTRIKDELSAESTIFVWRPIEPKGEEETRYNLSQLVRHGVVTLGTTAKITVHKETGTLVLSEYPCEVERDPYHDGVQEATIRQKGRIALPVVHTEGSPQRRDLRYVSTGETQLDSDTTVVPMAFAKSVYRGRPVVYLIPEEQYYRIEDVLLDYSEDVSDEPEGYTFVYWSEKVTDKPWDEPHWLALKVEPGKFKGPVFELVPDSDLCQIVG